MSPENSKAIQSILAPIFKRHGFKRKGATWYFQTSEFTTVFNIQGSQFGPSFYLNMGVYIRSLGEKEIPMSYDCHVFIRLDGIVPDPKKLQELLDFESTVTRDKRFQELAGLVEDYAVPWLLQMCSKEPLKAFLIDRGISSIRKAARDYLGIPDITGVA